MALYPIVRPHISSSVFRQPVGGTSTSIMALEMSRVRYDLFAAGLDLKPIHCSGNMGNVSERSRDERVCVHCTIALFAEASTTRLEYVDAQ